MQILGPKVFIMVVGVPKKMGEKAGHLFGLSFF
jgi:hypothetical protein